MRDFVCSYSATSIFKKSVSFIVYFIWDSLKVHFEFSSLCDSLYLKNTIWHYVGGLSQQMFFEEWFSTFFCFPT